MFARIGTRDVPVVKASIDWKQNEPATFNLTVPAADFADREDLLYEDVAVYRRDVKLISGIVWDKPVMEVDSDRRPLNYSVRCTDEIGRLSLVRADFFLAAHYQDVLVLDILLALMGGGIGWALGGTSTTFQPTLKTTVDLRGKETRLAQIMAVVKTIPKLWIRYGGIGTGNHLLDVGYFGQKTAYAVQGQNLANLKLLSNTQPQFRIVEAYADAGAGGTIRLQNALSYPSITSDPDWAQYPIVEEPAASGHFVVENTGLARGGQITKSFNIHRPRMDLPPSTVEVEQAGFAIWKDAVRFLQRSNNYKAYDLEANFQTIPIVNDKIYVNAGAREYVYDTDKGEWLETETYLVEETFHIVGVHTDIDEVMQKTDTGSEDQPAIICRVSISDNDYSQDIEPEDDFEERLYNMSVGATNQPPFPDTDEPAPDDDFNDDAGRCAVADYLTSWLEGVMDLSVQHTINYTNDTSAASAILGSFGADLTTIDVPPFVTEVRAVGETTVQAGLTFDFFVNVKCELLTLLTADLTITITDTIKDDWQVAVDALGTDAASSTALMIDAVTLNALRSRAIIAAAGVGFCDDCVSPGSADTCGAIDFTESTHGWSIIPPGSIPSGVLPQQWMLGQGQYVPGQGWKTTETASGQALAVWTPEFAADTIAFANFDTISRGRTDSQFKFFYQDATTGVWTGNGFNFNTVAPDVVYNRTVSGATPSNVKRIAMILYNEGTLHGDQEMLKVTTSCP